MNSLAILVVIVAVFAQSNALTVGSFSTVTGGVWDAWNQINPENVKNTDFGLQYGKGKLWLVSKRMHREGFTDPWDSAVRGGIVSTFNLSTKQWTHSPYDRIDEDKRGEKLFSLKGRLFMLSYSISQPAKIKFRKLFFWNDDTTQKWVEIPFDIPATASTNPSKELSAHTIAALTVNVPKADETSAYLVASAHERATGGGEFAFSKLDVEFRGNVPTKASLKSLKHEEVPHPSAVSFVALKNDKLYAFYQTFYSEGYQPDNMHVYTLDLKTETVANVALTGTAPPMAFTRVHQTDNEVFLAGGTQSVGGKIRDVLDIYALNLSTLQWQNTGSKVPAKAGKVSAYAEDRNKLFLVGLKEGVQKAEVTSN